MEKRLFKVVFTVLFLFSFFGFSKSWSGGVSIDFEIVNERMEMFANEFVKEMEKRKEIIVKFKKLYQIKGYFGSVRLKEDDQKISAIGIFVDKEERPVVIIFHSFLTSEKEIKKNAEKSAEKVLEHLLIKENELNELEI